MVSLMAKAGVVHSVSG